MRRLFSTFTIVAWLGSVASAQVNQAIRELATIVAEQLGRKEAGELAKFGGDAAVRQLFERAVQEGGEATARQLAKYAEEYGVAALRAAEFAPGRMVPALNSVGGELVRPAIYAAAREPAVITKLVTDFGDDALRLAARHPGVGPKIATTLGREGIETGLKLPTNEAVRFARYADDIAASPVPRATKNKLLDAMAKAPKRILDEIEKHPKVLMTAAGCATLIMLAHDQKGDLFGSPGDESTPPRPGFIERLFKVGFEAFKAPISVVMVIVGIGLAGWFGAKIWIILKSGRRTR